MYESSKRIQTPNNVPMYVCRQVVTWLTLTMYKNQEVEPALSIGTYTAENQCSVFQATEATNRVTRLCDFPSNGQLFTMGCLVKIIGVAHFIGYFFPREKLCFNIDEILFWLHFGRLFFPNSSGHLGHDRDLWTYNCLFSRFVTRTRHSKKMLASSEIHDRGLVPNFDSLVLGHFFEHFWTFFPLEIWTR
jgi:hypothetical protein